MAFDKETAARLESIYQQHLKEAFQGTITFDPITVEVTQNMSDKDAFHATVVYDGDSRLLDPAKLNRISSLMVDEATESSACRKHHPRILRRQPRIRRPS